MYIVTNKVEQMIIESSILKAKKDKRFLPDNKDIVNSTIEILSGDNNEIKNILESVNNYNTNKKI